MKLVTSREKYEKYVIKSNFKVICCRNDINWHQDEKASAPCAINIGPEQDTNVWVLLQLHAVEVWK